MGERVEERKTKKSVVDDLLKVLRRRVEHLAGLHDSRLAASRTFIVAAGIIHEWYRNFRFKIKFMPRCHASPRNSRAK